MLIKYRFTINGHSAKPSHKEDLSISYSRESQQMFYRAALEGSLTFLNRDFDFIMSQDFETEFVVVIEKSNDGGLTWANYFTGSFYKTDCNIDIDSRKIEVKLNTKDQYVNVLAGLEKEFDLLKLAPEKSDMSFQKRPLLQLYIPGDDFVSCYLSGSTWQQDVTEAESDPAVLVRSYHFALASTINRIMMNGMGDVGGEFVGENGHVYYGPNSTNKITLEPYQSVYQVGSFDYMWWGTEDIGSVWTDDNNYLWILAGVGHDVLRFTSFFHGAGIKSPRFEGETCELRHVKGATNTHTVLYTDTEYLAGGSLYSLRGVENNIIYYYCPTLFGFEDHLGPIYFRPFEGLGNLTGYKLRYSVFARFLLDVDTLHTYNTSPLSSPDLVEDNRNYTRAVGYAVDCLHVSNKLSDTPTKWGKATNGQYFVEPNPEEGTYYPLARSSWYMSSMWLKLGPSERFYEEKGRKTRVLKDAIQISEVIRVLLKEIDPAITHNDTEEYSKLLYADTNPLSLPSFRLLLTQKSNILASENSDPAGKAPITLFAVLDMLKNCFQAYWYIDGNNRFRIEHVSFFKKGCTYLNMPIVSCDLTTLIHKKNGKPWGYMSNKYSYDKTSMAERFQFKWMDDVTAGFEGLPIEVLSAYVQKGRVENISVSAFTTDLDYMLLNPAKISKDGFALFSTKWSFINNRYEVQYQGVSTKENSYYLQNGDLSFLCLLPNYWADDLPAKRVKINGYEKRADGIERRKKHKVSVPLLEDPNLMFLIKTSVGEGQIEKITINLYSRMADIELKYDTE